MINERQERIYTQWVEALTSADLTKVRDLIENTPGRITRLLPPLLGVPRLDSTELVYKALAPYFDETWVKHCRHKVQVKTTQTNYLARTGSKSPLSDPKTRQKIKQTCLQRYGVENPGGTSTVQEKIRQTSLARYGVSSTNQLKAVSDKKLTTRLSHSFEQTYSSFVAALSARQLTLLEDVQTLIKTQGISYLYTHGYRVKHSCGYEYLCHNTGNTTHMTVCPKCYQGEYRSTREIYWEKRLRESGEEVVTNSRSILGSGKEVDLYLPARGIALEFNGYYWHSSLFHDKFYHMEKTTEALKKGIKLYHIWEDTPESLVEALLFPQKRQTIYARKCEVVSGLYPDFVDRFHRHGSSPNSRIGFALKYEGEIVSAIQFSYRKGIWYNERYTQHPGYSVVGGFSRLMSAFRREHSEGTLVTYCDRDLTPDPSVSVYARYGFQLVGDSGPQMSYYVSKSIPGFRPGVYYRQVFQKHRLLELFPEEDSSQTEASIAEKHGIYQVFNSGTWKYVLDLGKPT